MQLNIFYQDTVCQLLDVGKMEGGISENLQCRFQRCFCSSRCSLFIFSPGRAFSITLWQFFGTAVEYRCRQVLMQLWSLWVPGWWFWALHSSRVCLVCLQPPSWTCAQGDSEDVQCLLCVSVANTAHLCVSISFLQFYFLCCCTTKRQKEWNKLIAHGTHTACIYTGQVTEHSVSPDAAKATPKFSRSWHFSLFCMKKIHIFLLVYIHLLCICLAGFSSVRLSHLYLLPTWTNFRKISALTCFLSVFTFPGAFFVSCAI